MKKFISLILAVLFLTSSFAAFAAPFPDLPADHWATQAVTVLAEKGLVEGYPNGTFKGDRAATRYEVAMIVARLVAYLEKQKPQVTKEDLDMIKKLVDEYADELAAMGVRLKNVEDMLASLERRVTELERVKWSGGFESRFVTNGRRSCPNCTGPGTTAFAGGITPFQVDANAVGIRLPIGDQNALWDNAELHNPDRETPSMEREGYPFDRAYNIYPFNAGSSLTEEGYLKVAAKLSDEYTAGGVVTFYNNVGYLGNGFIYGTTPPTASNPFQTGNSAIIGTATSNFSANLNQIFVTNEKQHLNIAVGDWRPAYIPTFMLQGLPNMGVFGPDYLPFYGGQIYGQLQGTVGSGIKYEGVAGRLSTFNLASQQQAAVGSGALATLNNGYQNMIYGGALGYTWKDQNSTLDRVDLTGSFIRAQDDSVTAAAGLLGVPNPGLWASSLTPISIGSLNAGFPGQLGPQTENLYGGEVKVKFGQGVKWLSVFAKYGNSKYQASASSATPVSSVSGSMAAGGFNIDNGGKLTGGAEFLWVQPQYDPFIARIPIQTAAFNTGTAFNPMWMGYPYPVSYGGAYTSYLSGIYGFPLGGGANNPLSGTNAGGDQYYNLHDAREYPNNRTGYRAHMNWNYGHGNVGGQYEDLKQTQISSLQSALTPGFYEPLFPVIPTVNGQTQPNAFYTGSGIVKGRVKTYQIYADYTVPSKELSLDGLYINNRTVRLTGDYNNVDLLSNYWKAGVTYRPTEKWSLLTGYERLKAGGAGQYLEPAVNTFGVAMPAFALNGVQTGNIATGSAFTSNYLFTNQGPYFGVNYAFVKNATAWILYRLDNVKDGNNNGYAGFGGTQLQSGVQFTF